MTKKIIAAFNSGDIEEIKNIIYESTIPLCEVCFSSLQHIFIGKNALYSLWLSLFEAFPNGIFRTSQCTINDSKQVYTSFVFFGTKIFPLLIDGVPMDFQQPTINMIEPTIIQSASIVIDQSRLLYSTEELLDADDIPDMVFEGRIIVQLNDNFEINRFDFSWSRKV